MPSRDAEEVHVWLGCASGADGAEDRRLADRVEEVLQAAARAVNEPRCPLVSTIADAMAPDSLTRLQYAQSHVQTVCEATIGLMQARSHGVLRECSWATAKGHTTLLVVSRGVAVERLPARPEPGVFAMAYASSVREALEAIARWWPIRHDEPCHLTLDHEQLEAFRLARYANPKLYDTQRSSAVMRAARRGLAQERAVLAVPGAKHRARLEDRLRSQTGWNALLAQVVQAA